MSDSDERLTARIRSVIDAVGSAVPDPSDSPLPQPAPVRRTPHRGWVVAAAGLLVVGGIAAVVARRDDVPSPAAPDTTTATIATSTTPATTTPSSTSTTTSPTTTAAHPQVSFTPLGMATLPEGYTVLWARYEKAGDGTTFGMVRFRAGSDQPDLALLIRPWPDGASRMLDAGRKSWSQSGRTVVSDGEGNGSCLPDTCSVGVQWDSRTYVSVMWIQNGSTLLGPEHTLESLVQLTSALSEKAAPTFVPGTLEFT